MKTGRPNHGHCVGGRYSPTYYSWVGMVSRCTNPKAKGWSDYGGRGITVCERWLSFELFLQDMGERAGGATLDRKDNNLGYYKENCRWVSMREQAFNRRNNKLEQHEPDQIRWLVSLGYIKKQIASFFGISPAYVTVIHKGR